MSSSMVTGGVRRPKTSGTVLRLRVGGSAVCFVGYLLGICSIPLVVRWGMANSLMGVVALAFFAGGQLYDLGRRIDLRGRRLASAPRGPEWMPAEGSFVLFLRSFKDDNALRVMDMQFRSHRMPLWGAGDSVVQSGFTREEQIVAALREIGPVVAVGKPHEPLPEAGAIRTYRPHDQWQDAVLEFMRRARFVFIVLGSGEGLTWELSQALQRVPPERLALVVFGELTRPADYRQIRNLVESQVVDAADGRRLRLPDHPGLSFPDNSWTIAFDEAGRATTSVLKLGVGGLLFASNKIVYKSIRKFIRPIADRLTRVDGARPKGRPRRRRTARVFAAVDRFARLTVIPIFIFQLSRPGGLVLISAAFVAVILWALLLSLARPSS